MFVNNTTVCVYTVHTQVGEGV